MGDDKDFQFLLEVEFRNGRIYNVKDVSNKQQQYFNRENTASVRATSRSPLYTA